MSSPHNSLEQKTPNGFVPRTPSLKPPGTLAGVDVEYGSSDPDFSHIDSKKVLRKMDRRILPIVTLLYLMNYIDRGNIGNAKIEGLIPDLHITSQQFNLTLTVFFFSYAVFEIPSNILLKKLKPAIWLPSIMVAWGVIGTLMGLVQNFTGLLVARLFLGFTEAGLFPGVVYYISTWYAREDSQYRQALFYCAAIISGSFSGLLAFAISKMDGAGGLEGWRWIFILEGIATVVIAIFAYFTIPNSFETAKFLTPEEKEWVAFKVGSMLENSKAKFSTVYLKQALTDWQVLTAMRQPVSPNHYQRPGIPVCRGSAAHITIVGGVKNLPGLVYAGVFVAVCGLYTAFPGNITWISNNVAGSYKRSVALAIHVGWGNLGGAVSSNIYRAQDSPKFILGHVVAICSLLVALTAVLTLRLGYQHCNRQRDRNASSQPQLSIGEEIELGDKSPSYRYMI
ncbi:hypothetical protein B7463_g580, partial [Scytalidium lignicola]